MANFIDLFAKRVLDSGLSTYWSMSGCSQGEIQRLESKIDLKLPSEYKAFLRKMGHGARRFMQGTDMFYSRLFDNRSDPPVLGFQEGEPSLTRISESFSQFLSQILEEEISNWKGVSD